MCETLSVCTINLSIILLDLCYYTQIKVTRSPSMNQRANVHLHPLAPVVSGEPIRDKSGDTAASSIIKSLKSIPIPDIKTRTVATEREYKKRWAYILDSIEFHSEDMIYNWFLAARSKYLPSSYRKYKAAAIWAGAVHEALVEKIKPLNSTITKKNTGKRTSAKKRKSINERDFGLLCLYLDGKKTPINRTTLLYCHAALMTGFRPSEWASAKLIDDTIVIMNGKNTNGRASGETRTLALSTDPESLLIQRRVLTDFIDITPKTSSKEFSDFMKGIYRCLRRASFQIFGHDKAVCLYTFRHQYSANMKKRNGKATTALAMGHRSDKTAGQSYARAIQSWSDSAFAMNSPLIELSADSVDDVNKV